MSRRPKWETPAWRASVKAAQADPHHAATMLAELRSWLETLATFEESVVAQRGAHLGFAFASYHRLVLETGEAHTAAPRPRGLRKGRDRNCFPNALHLAIQRDDLTYVEGYAYPFGGIVVDHAWCVTEDGTVVDPTWREPDLAAYLGIRIPTDIAGRIVSRQGVYGVLCNDWRNDQAILKAGRVE